MAETKRWHVLSLAMYVQIDVRTAEDHVLNANTLISIAHAGGWAQHASLSVNYRSTEQGEWHDFTITFGRGFS